MAHHYLNQLLQVLCNRHPVKYLNAILRFFIWRIGGEELSVKYQTEINRWLNHIHYCAPPKPYKKIHIKPNEINHRIRNPPPSPSVSGLSQIREGSWDSPNNYEKIESLGVVKGFKQRFNQGMEWEDTAYYKELCENWSCKDIKDSEAKTVEEAALYNCEFYESLYDNIKNNGYVPNHTGSTYDGRTGIEEKLEVLVSIDRDGQIHLYEGKHRFTIARIENLKIPAHVVCRHKQWQEIRDEINTNGFSSENRKKIQSHPDIQDVGPCESPDEA
jgi:hypothetical protein